MNMITLINKSLGVFILLILVMNSVAAVGYVTYDNDNVPKIVIPASTGTTNINNSYVTNNNTYVNGTIPGDCPDDYVVQNTTTGGVECVLRDAPSTTYLANTSAVTGGSYIGSTNINATWYYNGASLNFSEGPGVNPMTVYINYTGVEDFSQWVTREYYGGSVSHHMVFQIWDYDSSSWESYDEIVGQTGMVWVTIPIFDPSNHISGGVVQTRYYHEQSGNPAHEFYIDVAWLIDGANVGASTNLDGYARYVYGSNNFNGSGNFTTTGDIKTDKVSFSFISWIKEVISGWLHIEGNVNINGTLNVSENIIINGGNITSTNETFGMYNDGDCIVLGDLTYASLC